MECKCVECGKPADCLMNMSTVCFDCLKELKARLRISTLLTPMVPVEVYRAIINSWENEGNDIILPSENEVDNIMKKFGGDTDDPEE